MKYLNLTNGLIYEDKKSNYIRIQSTACEQKRWDFIIQDLDNDFLYRLATGEKCIIYDKSEKDRIPRAMWQGVEWIKFVLWQRWYGIAYTPIMRNGDNCTLYFKHVFMNLDKRTFQKVDYFRKFVTHNNADKNIYLTYNNEK